MAQTTLTGPQEHPLAEADYIKRIESDPATWLHDDGDVGRCRQCNGLIALSKGAHLTVTLVHGNALNTKTRIKRLCSEECYRDWASEGMDTGW